MADKFADIKEGDEVLVFEGRRRFTLREMYENGIPGKVTAVKRKYFTVECERNYLSGDYRIDTGYDRAGHRSFVMTQHLIGEEHLRYAAEDVITAAGLVFKTGRVDLYTVEQLVELAELLKKFREENK